jgi:hypothetical protein
MVFKALITAFAKIKSLCTKKITFAYSGQGREYLGESKIRYFVKEMQKKNKTIR